MTHDETYQIDNFDDLLAKFKDYEAHFDQVKDEPKIFAALRAVVESHKPLLVKDYENDNYWYECQECSGNGFSALYPCQTIKVIEKELG